MKSQNLIKEDFVKDYIRNDDTGAYETLYSILHNKSETVEQICSDLNGKVPESKIRYHLRRFVGSNVLLLNTSEKVARYSPMIGLSEKFMQEFYNMRSFLKN